MRFLLAIVVTGILGLTSLHRATAQFPGPEREPEQYLPSAETPQAVPGPAPAPAEPAVASPQPLPDGPKVGAAGEPLRAESAPQERTALPQPQPDPRQEQQPIQQVAANDIEKLQKQLDLQRKMIDNLNNTVKLLKEQLEKGRGAGPPAEEMETLQTNVATLEARSKQAAQRDQDVAQAIDNLNEHMDAEERNGPRLPANLKELFLPSRTNETPLSIYGQFLENFTQLNGKPPVFSSPDFAPYFLLQLNDQFLLEANIDINNGGVSVAEAQVDWIAADWLTVVIGRFITPIGYFNERLNHEWINRMPDVPLMFNQVSPLVDTDGIQLRGSKYLGCWPVKVEYSLYGGNGLQSNFAAPGTVTNVADLAQITGGSDEFDIRALGGRLGFWVPEWGFNGGISTYFNGRYISAANGGSSDQFNLWQLDLGYRHGNWDARFEYANVHQQAASYIGNNIRRQGLYAQLVYRPFDSHSWWLQKCEVGIRYSRAWFHGIDPTLIDFTGFGSPVSVPVDRDQWTFGFSYYPYAAMALRLAYEINHEFNGINLHDNQLLGQFVWSF
jgi:hypothetical protein